MKTLSYFWNRLSDLGLGPEMNYFQQRRVRLVNQLILILLPILCVLSNILYTAGAKPASGYALVLIPVLLSLLFLNYKKQAPISLLLLAFLLPVFVITAPILTGNYQPEALKAENYINVKMLLLCTQVAVIVIVDFKKRFVLYPVLLWGFSIFIFFYQILDWFGVSPQQLGIVIPGQSFIDSVYLLAFFMITFLVLFLLQVNLVYENKNLHLLAETQEKNEELLTIEEEIRQNLEELQTIQEAMEQQHSRLLLQNDQIQSSIRYASTIQMAMLPSEEQLESLFDEFFRLYLPKDIVSGDFYWSAKLQNSTYLALIDCTGHGVPGAFMSLIGNAILNHLVIEKKLTEPGQVLSELHFQINALLKQDYTENHDGMDIGFCRLDQLPDQKWDLHYAGAKIDVYLMAQGELKIIKGTRQSIGGTWDKEKIVFSQEKIRLAQHDQIYLSSDGLFDLPNPQRKKYGKKRLMNFIKSHYQLPLHQQKEGIKQSLREFQHTAQQRDDILVIGIRLG